jgi:hypothetical protein
MVSKVTKVSYKKEKLDKPYDSFWNGIADSVNATLDFVGYHNDDEKGDRLKNAEHDYIEVELNNGGHLRADFGGGFS